MFGNDVMVKQTYSNMFSVIEIEQLPSRAPWLNSNIAELDKTVTVIMIMKQGGEARKVLQGGDPLHHWT